MSKRFLLIVAICASTIGPLASAAGPQVHVVLGADAPRLECFAAEELKAQLERLFDAEVQMSAELRPQTDHTILLGSTVTNPAIASAGFAWPKLSEQGHLLRSVTVNNRPALVVGGGSPVATLWAVYELGQRFGLRYFLFGDLDPVTRPEFKLKDFNVLLEPKIETRFCRAAGDSLLGPGMWGLEEQQKVLRQMAKLKFNGVIVPYDGWQPPPGLSVAGDTAGRAAFRGVPLFENAEFTGKQTEAERTAASDRLVKGIVEIAHELGMTTSPMTKPAGPELPRMVHMERQMSVLPRAEYRKLAQMPIVKRAALPYGQLGDLDLTAYYFGRVAFGEKLSPEHACDELVTPVCGEEVSGRVWKAFQFIEQATALVDKHDPQLGAPSPEMLLRHQRKEPAPQWWTEAKDAYLNAMNEMYRANTRAREGGRTYTLYHARRCEFAFQYMNCLLAVRKAGIAKAKPDADARITELESAVESIYGALNALAAVARSSSDRGTIAVLNEYGYRPLKRELESAEQSGSR